MSSSLGDWHHRVPLRVSIVGAGRIVERVYLPLLAEQRAVRVDAVFDVDADRGARVAGRMQARPCRTLRALLERRPDAVIVASPNYVHAETAVAALSAGCHVLCEKPMALDHHSARAMAAAAVTHGRHLAINYPQRFRPEVLALSRIIESGRLGTLRTIRCGWIRRNGVPGAGTWFTDKARAGGGALIDLGSHMVNLVLLVAGRRPVHHVGCTLERSLESTDALWYKEVGGSDGAGPFDVETGAVARFVMDGPLDVSLEASWHGDVDADRTYLHVEGANGMAAIESLFGLNPTESSIDYGLRVWVQGVLIHETAPSPDRLHGYRAQLCAFLDAIRSGRLDTSLALQDSISTTSLIGSLYQAAAGRRARDQSTATSVL